MLLLLAGALHHFSELYTQDVFMRFSNCCATILMYYLSGRLHLAIKLLKQGLAIVSVHFLSIHVQCMLHG